MAITPHNRLAGSYNWTLSTPFRKSNTTNWITFCVGDVPSDETLANLTALTNAVIVDNKAGMLASNAGAGFVYSSATTTPPTFYLNTLPTVKTFTVTKAGTLSYAVVNAGGAFIVVSVGLLNSGAVIQVDRLNVNVGDVVTLQHINFKMWS